jgi:hypothetical protein
MPRKKSAPHGSPVRRRLRLQDIGAKIRAAPALRSALHLTRARSGALRAAELSKAGLVVTTIESEANRGSYIYQGDPTLNTEGAFQKRLALRTAPLVLDVLQAWWVTALRSLRSGAYGGPASSKTAISKDQYVVMSHNMYHAMVEEWDEDDADAVAEAEWQRDSQGASELSREAFLDAIFEVADVWTPTIDEAEYADFLWRLLRRIADGDPPDALFWREESAVSFDESYADGPQKARRHHAAAGSRTPPLAARTPPPAARAPPIRAR